MTKLKRILKTIWIILKKYVFPFLGKLCVQLYKLSRKYPKATGIIIFIIFICALTSFWSYQKKVEAKKVHQAFILAEQQKRELLEKQKKEFSKNSKTILDQLSYYKENRDWEALKKETEPYLQNDNVQLNKLYETAIIEIEKEKTHQRLEKHKQEKIRKSEEYIELTKIEIEDLKKRDVSKHLGSLDEIMTFAAIYSGIAYHLDKERNHDLNEEQKQVVNELKKTLIKIQKKELPILRDAYGPILRKALWKKDIHVRTFGKGMGNIEFSAGEFATNRNIDFFQSGLDHVLNTLRFKQVRYKWFKEDDEYTYYDVDTPADGDIAVFEKDGYMAIN